MALNAYRLIGDDCSISIALNGAWTGAENPYPIGSATPPAGETLVVVTGFCKSIKHTEKLDKINVKGMGDTRKRNRYHAAEGELTIESFVPSTGYLVSFGALGEYITVIYNPLSTSASPETYVGIVTGWDLTSNENGEQSVSITIDLDPDYLAAG